MAENLPKVTLDAHGAFIARHIALHENRSLANAVGTLLREAWAARNDAELKRLAPNMPLPTAAQ